MAATAEYPFEIEVQDHFIVLYELDGYPIDTQKARRLFLQPGQGPQTKTETVEVIHA